MKKKSLYREYRPETFNAVIGQEFITTTLKNQIKNNRVSHAYLFTGIRGTGKTSTARVFARVLNCLSPVDYEPCNKCSNCIDSLNDTMVDLIEIDAASNNSVEDIKQLREQVKFLPSIGKYKIYIIDEVHMLSISAFNALLKTIEEPPEYLVFILATTDPHKIPDTVKSRTQRYDFQRINETQMKSAIKNICNIEKIEITEDALDLLVLVSEGSMRDCNSSLDKCISTGESVIDESVVSRAINLANNDEIIRICKHIIDDDIENTILTIRKIVYNSGLSVGYLVSNLMNLYRDIMLYRATGTVSVLNSKHEKLQDFIVSFSEKHTIEQSVRILEVFTELEFTLRKEKHNELLLLEMSIIKIMSPEYFLDYSSVIQRISTLEYKISQLKKSHVQSNKPSEKSEDVSITSALTDIIQSDDIKTTEIKKAEKIIKSETADQKLGSIIDENEIIFEGFDDDSSTNNSNSNSTDNIRKDWNKIIESMDISELYKTILINGYIKEVDNDNLILVFSSSDSIYIELLKENYYNTILDTIKIFNNSINKVLFEINDIDNEEEYNHDITNEEEKLDSQIGLDSQIQDNTIENKDIDKQSDQDIDILSELQGMEDILEIE